MRRMARSTFLVAMLTAAATAGLLARSSRAQATPPPCPAAPAGYDAALWQRAWALHHTSLVIDTHVDTTSRILDQGFDMGPRAADGHVDLPRAHEGGLDAVFYSIYVDTRFFGDEAALFANPPPSVNDDWPRPADVGRANGSARRALAMIDGLVRTVDRHAERMALCTCVDELRAATQAGRHAALMGNRGRPRDRRRPRSAAPVPPSRRPLHDADAHAAHEFADSCAPAEPRWTASTASARRSSAR
jgi:hypothetical protein